MNQLKNIFISASEELSTLPAWERFMMYFWLSGPFLFLIERSPADFWVVVIDIAFLFRCVRKGQWTWMEWFWVRAVFVFWLATFLSAAFSPLSLMALAESIAWIRFPLLAIASVFWLSRHAALIKLMLLMTGLGLILMCFILTAELYVNFSEWSSVGGMSARLSWPYGDFVSGNYLGKFGLIIAVWASANVSAPNADRIIAGASIGLLLLIFTILTGERINAILVFSTLSLALLWLNYWRIKFLVVGGSCLVGGAILAISSTDYLTDKFTSSFFEGIFDFQTSGYIKLWMTGLEIFKDSPITGVGTGMFRYLCTEMPFADTSFIRCDNHPHQYYVQILAETGIIGFGAFVLMVGSIIYATWDEGRLSSNSLSKVCFVVPLALMFPLQSTADIFGQWVNLMMWYSIALAMAVPASTVAKSSQLRQ